MADTEEQEVGDFWPGFQVLFEMPATSSLEGVAKNILESFHIPFNGSVEGGSLANVDIKRADALATLKASLLETFAEGEGSKLKEIRINPEGEAEIYDVGTNSSDIHPYYTIEASTYIKPKVSVTVTGAKPQQQRIIYPWYELIGSKAKAENRCTLFDTSYFNSSCLSNLVTHATITYQDPFRNTPNSNWNNGIKETFELNSPFERFIGFSWRVTPPQALVTPYTKIYQQSQASVPVALTGVDCKIGMDGPHPNIGKLVRRKVMLPGVGVDIQNCTIFDGEYRECSEDSVKLNIPILEGLTYDTVRKTTVSKFLGVSGVFVIGIPIRNCFGVPADEKAARLENTASNTVLSVFTSNVFRTIIKLNEGIHYATLYPSTEDDPNFENLPCFQFVNNLRYYDYANVGTAVNFYVNPLSAELDKLYGEAEVAIGTILPLENLNGILVEQVIAQANLDTPCFVVTDPTKSVKEIAENLKVELLAMAIRDLPSPISINGKLINQEDGIVDNDPTTQAQELQETEMEKALNEMGSGRAISITMASLNEDHTVLLSQKLYDILSDDNGAIFTHTCPPSDNPKVGDKGKNGGIINVIEYSYTDQGSYLINITEGPESFGDFSGIDGGIYQKQTEELTTKGTIIEDLGNHVQYRVHVDGYGDIWAINGCASVLGLRDRVSITIHNNAVEK